MNPNPPTLADVARAAGVSVATALKALNGKAHVSPAHARRCSPAAALRFTPNPFARALNHASTHTIGMLTRDLDARFIIPILIGAEDAFGDGSLSVLLADARDNDARELPQLDGCSRARRRRGPGRGRQHELLGHRFHRNPTFLSCTCTQPRRTRTIVIRTG